MISALIWPLLVGLLISGLFEALLSPRPRPFWQRGAAANSVHLGSWLLLFGLLVLLLQRPWFAVMVCLSLQLVVVQSSNAKSHTLNEPFICHDFEYFWDAILHPRLYVPFFGVGLAIAASSAAAVAIGGFFYWEGSLVTSEGANRFLTNALGLIALGSLLLAVSVRRLPAIVLQPIDDMHRLGLFASLWAYGVALMRAPVRTECAVLTGIAPDHWGIRQFNPYRTLARHPMPSLASALKAAGYRTVCVHPYLASFYFRHKVIPQLGFDHFIDINAFQSSDKNGQYVSDQAVARKIGRLLEDDDNRPLFVFVITMENHGPLHLEAPNQATLADTLPGAPWPLPDHLRDLAVYLQHLSESDKMLASVKNSLNTAKRPGLLGWYGDHVPILPEAYAHFTPPDGRTPYMVWSTESWVTAGVGAANTYEPFELAANELGVQLFKQVFGHDISSDVIKVEPEPQEQE